jgi:hypothetical protein
MASIITATNSNGLTHVADNSGVLQLASGTGNLVTVPSVTGTAMVSGNMPAFSVYRTSSQTISTNTYTKIQFNAEVFDTNSCFDTSTYRFTPNVAGYYQINLNTSDATGFTSGYQYAVIYKNGSIYARTLVTNSSFGLSATCSTIVYCNGTSDYIEGYYFQASGSNSNLAITQLETFMTGCLLRMG